MTNNLPTEFPSGVAILRDVNNRGHVGLLFDDFDRIVGLSRREAVALSDALALAAI